MTSSLNLLIMDPPYESERTTTAFRLIDAALARGHSVRVFAYEGAVNLTMAGQAAHPNPLHGTDVDAEMHPTTREWVERLFAVAGGRLEWVNCGLCVDERGAGDWTNGPRRGGPADFTGWVTDGSATIVIPTA